MINSVYVGILLFRKVSVNSENASNLIFARLIIFRVFVSNDCTAKVTAPSIPPSCSCFAIGIIFSDEFLAHAGLTLSG